ncbi:hypothetical protein PENSUB_13666 [Penicillium subrubescens]|uniref:Uncharacterized protein n=1 Tax=Penicillium subrubescens TaxID=1316194 RepID=A0A1Q5SNQ8_9EURO|nr:hypothetical protein PENSUB_13666 [Penicillium subrubescens]
MFGLYTDEFHQPQPDFVREIRHNMAAIVETCWGNVVWKEMKRELGPLLFFVRSGLFRLGPEARRAYGQAEDLALTGETAHQ